MSMYNCSMYKCSTLKKTDSITVDIQQCLANYCIKVIVLTVHLLESVVEKLSGFWATV